MKHAVARGLVVLASGWPVVAGAGDDTARFAQGRQLFLGQAAPACAVCHTLKEAGSEGQVGPVLDELRPDAARVATALRNGVGSMPSYRETLTDAQIDALAHYVARASGAVK